MKDGLFITFEGGEGSGKTTQIALLSDYLASKYYKVYVTREPGGSKGAESIRNLLVTGNPDKWDPETEALLMYAARRDNYIRVIRPNLNEGKIVISDRFSDSTNVYQGIVGGVSQEKINLLHNFCLDNFQPDLTFILDIDVKRGLSRANSRKGNENRFESKGTDFHNLVRDAYLDLASKNKKRMYIIDASKSITDIYGDIKNIFDKYIKENI